MRIYIAAAIASLAAAGAAPTANAEQIWLTMDQVRPYELQSPAGQIVVGNPSIADISVQDKQRVLLFGKAPGLTNMYIFDENGDTVDNLVIRVKSSNNDMLTMHRGAQRTTYNCTTQCEATITVGDSLASFTEVSQQVQQKLQQASSSANNN